MRSKIRDQKYETKNTRSKIRDKKKRPKIRDQKLEAIKCEVVWSWIGMRSFLQNDLVPSTPILLKTAANTAK